MIAYPFSKGAQFGNRDIQELIFLLKESPEGTMVRLPRVSQIFATRACHKSVTIGHRLTNNKMRRILNNMGTLVNPWSCPHGRPTMRHLFDLQTIPQVVKKNQNLKKIRLPQK